MTQKNKPVAKYRIGKSTITVWLNKGEGKNKDYKTYQLNKNYMDNNKEWQTTNSYTRSELYDQLNAIQKALSDEVKDATQTKEEDD